MIILQRRIVNNHCIVENLYHGRVWVEIDGKLVEGAFEEVIAEQTELEKQRQLDQELSLWKAANERWEKFCATGEIDG